MEYISGFHAAYLKWCKPSPRLGGRGLRKERAMNDAKQWRESVANEIHDAVRAANGNISYGAITDALFAKVPVLAAAPELLEALTAIRARIAGEWDNPSLIKFGALSEDTEADIKKLAQAAIRKAEGR